MKWFIVYIVTTFGAPTDVVITQKSYDTLGQCQLHEYFEKDDKGTFNALCVQENTFEDFTRNDFADALVFDTRQFKIKTHRH